MRTVRVFLSKKVNTNVEVQLVQEMMPFLSGQFFGLAPFFAAPNKPAFSEAKYELTYRYS